MSAKQQFIIELLKAGKPYAYMLLAFLSGGTLGWHIPQPPWMKKKSKEEG